MKNEPAKMKKILIVKMIAILASILSGCVLLTGSDMENAKQEKYNKDSIECEKNSQENGFYGGVIGKQDMAVFFKKCMIAKGWTSVQPL
jgi:ABC-type iron transport system FetAB ATPase subunit